MRNGNRWRVTAIDTETNRVAAVRLDDHARVVFGSDYLRDHVRLGYAVTVHSAQGVTADASYAVLSENTSRALLYVALIRGRQANTANLYQRSTGDHEYGQEQPGRMHLKNRGGSHEAAQLVRSILANDQQVKTAHEFASLTEESALPPRVRSLVDRRAAARHDRETAHETWSRGRRNEAQDRARARSRATKRNRDRGVDNGIEL